MAEAGGGQGRHGQERVPDAFRRGDRSGASLAPEPTGTGIGQRHMAQPNTRSPAGGGKPDWRIATGTGHLELDRRAPASGKPGRRLLQNGYLSKWPVLGHQLPFQQEVLQRQPHASAGSILPRRLPCRVFHRCNWSTPTIFMPRRTAGNDVRPSGLFKSLNIESLKLTLGLNCRLQRRGSVTVTAATPTRPGASDQ